MKQARILFRDSAGHELAKRIAGRHFGHHVQDGELSLTAMFSNKGVVRVLKEAQQFHLNAEAITP